MVSDRVPLSWRLLPLSPLLLTTTVSITLLILNNRQYTGNLVSQIRSSRATIAITVQISAHLLAFLQIYVARTLFNFATRILFLDKNVNLENYAFWASGSQLSMDWSLPTRYIVWLAAALFLSAFPGAIWAGALTPVINGTVTVQAKIGVPTYSNASSHYWDTEFVEHADLEIWNMIDTCTTSTDKRGFIPGCPVPALEGPLLQSASTATPDDIHSTRKHAKLDNLDWFYWGRSYGVGSGIPLNNLIDSDQTRTFAPISSLSSDENSTSTATKAEVQAFTFHETGYNSQVTCFKNESSQLQWINLAEPSANLAVYWLTGNLPTVPQNLSDDFPATTWWNDYSRLLAWKARAWKGENMISIASGLYNYTEFNQTECTVDFIPTNYEVLVNLTAKNITVTPLPGSPSTELEPTGHLTANAIQSLNLLSRMSNSHYVSVKGEAFKQNYLNTRLRMNLTANSDSNSEDSDPDSNSNQTQTAILSAVEDSFTAMIDDILVAYGVSQVLHIDETGDQNITTANVVLTAARIGDPIYIYVSLGINTALVLVVLVEAVRWRLWHRMPAFDLSNVKCTAFSASHGGQGIAEQVLSNNNNGLMTINNTWDGGPTNPAFNSTMIRYLDDTSGPKLVGTTTATTTNDDEYLLKQVHMKNNTSNSSDSSLQNSHFGDLPTNAPSSMLSQGQGSHGYSSLRDGVYRDGTGDNGLVNRYLINH